MSVTDKLILNICKWLLIFAIFKSQKSFLKSYMSTHYRVMNDVRDCWVYSEHQGVISLILCDMKCNRKWRINVVAFCCWVLHIQLVLYIIFYSLIPRKHKRIKFVTLLLRKSLEFLFCFVIENDGWEQCRA